MLVDVIGGTYIEGQELFPAAPHKLPIQIEIQSFPIKNIFLILDFYPFIYLSILLILLLF